MGPHPSQPQHEPKAGLWPCSERLILQDTTAQVHASVQPVDPPPTPWGRLDLELATSAQ